jgi:ferric-dicitrate binding protein FerR (iron transport regulator)
MSELYDSEFIRRYLSGKCLKEEKDNFLRFLEDPQTDNHSEWMNQIWEDAADDCQVYLGAEEKILQKVLQKLPDQAQVFTTSPLEKKAILAYFYELWRTTYTMRYAAIILFFMVTSFVINVLSVHATTEIPIVKLIDRKTHNGQHLTFMLDDGTKIHLNSNSTLTYPEVFSDSTRVVRLTGEGFFEVAHDSKRPFIVNTGEISTTALGTSFNIHYHENRANISLLTGMVKVEVKETDTETERFTLSPGHELHCDLSRNTYLLDEFSPIAVIGWKDGVLYFENASLDNVVSTLEEWYDVSIQTDNRNNRNMSNWSYSGKFENQTLENVLRGMGYVEKFKYEIDGKKVKLMFN